MVCICIYSIKEFHIVMSPAMVPSLGHSCLDMEQELSLIPALAKWKIDLEDQICHGIIYFSSVMCQMLLSVTWYWFVLNCF